MSRRYELLMRQSKRRRKRRRIAALVIAVLLLVVFVGSFFFICRASAPKQYITYTVQSGDTLWSIARDIYGDSCDIRYKIDDIERENGIMDARIYVGMRLRVAMESKSLIWETTPMQGTSAIAELKANAEQKRSTAEVDSRA